ncbi:hypothetical protein [Pedobacter sp. ASV28]|uniref:hypothetical protein n=1 Tax=Pedobacter sp. ASV28 TaxID=2795123 RepID=UPI0018EB4714|nr:hypothetical protein [Pedobacter sp. ASV28]
MKIKIFKKALLRLSVLILLLGSASYFSWAFIKERKAFAKKEALAVKEKLPKINYDKRLLLRFEELSRQLDPNREEYSLIGKLVYKDGTDSLAKAKQALYEIRKKGSSYYYKLGTTEILNANGQNVTVDHLNKYIMISAQKEQPQAQLFPQVKELLKNLQRERYELSNTEKDGIAYISLLNNYHISCKEYGISYRKEDLSPLRLFIRLTNFDDPESVAKEKVITLSIEQFESRANWNEHVGQLAFAQQVNGQWEASAPYKDYKLIVL